MYPQVSTVGESMVVFTPVTEGGLEGSSCFQRGLAGAESNVSIGLARLGHSVRWIGRVGTDEFGRYILGTLQREGVDVSNAIADAAHQTGVYFKEISETGEANVRYYRRNSAASYLSVDNLTGCLTGQYLFVTGITPAISHSAGSAIDYALHDARTQNMTIVFDPNIRLGLWENTSLARETLLQIAARSDIVLPGVSEGNFLLGTSDPAEIARSLRAMGAERVVVKLGRVGAYYEDQQEVGFSPGFAVKQLDAVGAGDAFAAGLLSGLLDGLFLGNAVRRACAMGAVAVTAVGDCEGLPTRNELERFIAEHE